MAFRKKLSSLILATAPILLFGSISYAGEEVKNLTPSDLVNAQKEPILEHINEQVENAPPEFPSATIIGYDKIKGELIFTPLQLDLNEQQKERIKSDIINSYIQGRVTIESFASPQEDFNRSPRRVSLERAIVVREFLIEHKIPKNMIDIFPVGAQGGNIRDLVKISVLEN